MPTPRALCFACARACACSVRGPLGSRESRASARVYGVAMVLESARCARAHASTEISLLFNAEMSLECARVMMPLEGGLLEELGRLVRWSRIILERYSMEVMVLNHR